MAEIKLAGLCHRYPGAAEDALMLGDFCWQDGGAYALLGPSGCGKSTLLNIISGLLVPTKGDIYFDGTAVTKQNTRERNIAQVFQFPVVYDTMTVFENLAFPLRNRGIDNQSIHKRVNTIAELLELDSSLQKKAQGLSADQKQLISLGRGLVRSDVSAILFDEPLTVIDPHQKFLLRRKLKEIHRQFKLTLIYVTHDQSEALTFADQVVVMDKGKILQVGSPEQLFENPAHRFVGHFIGSPGMNFLPGELRENGIDIDGDVIELESAIIEKAKSQLNAGGSNHNAKIEIGIRPEYLLMENNVEDESSAIWVSTNSIDNYGSHQMLEVSFKHHQLMVKAHQAPTKSDLKLYFPKKMTKLYIDDQLVVA